MAKRMLECVTSDFQKFKKQDWLESIGASEGRVIACETIGMVMPMLGNITNAEFAASMGADILLLNIFDVKEPVIHGLPKVEASECIRELKRLTGRMIGINLEPVEDGFVAEGQDEVWKISEGRKATLENAGKALEMGVDMVLLTGNPGNGVKNQAITDTLRTLKAELGDKLILAAGKMHASGVLSEGGEHIITKKDVEEFIEAGADIVLFPAPGTVPGITMEYVRSLVETAHSRNVLTMTSIGTSQEGADESTIRQIALMCKMAGTDIHHLGDSGYVGMALPENILAYSKVIRGVRHTYRRMAASVNR
ncbi:MAG: haloacid dehalogenase-like hydrolase [Lachnospiraceae bacterium]|nr:haloacid dehalogenase-like hydrolase [Lachnospiraceae bacterium]